MFLLTCSLDSYHFFSIINKQIILKMKIQEKDEKSLPPLQNLIKTE